MERIPSSVQRVIAKEQNCRLLHFYQSICDGAAHPVTLETTAYPSSGSDREETPESSYQMVYDVLRARNGRILFKEAYAERFAHSLSLVAPSYPFPPDFQSLIQRRLKSYIDAPGVWSPDVTDQNVKLLAWLPAAPSPAAAFPIPTVVMLIKSSYPAESMYQEGAKFGLLYEAHRVHPNAKVIQAELRARATAYQADHHVYEVLLVHDAADSYLVPEGSRSNFLLQRHDGSWWCSTEEDILVGITLKTVHGVVEECGFGRVHHAKLTLKDILECKSLYMLGTSPIVMPVQSLLLYTDAPTRQCYEDAVKALGACPGAIQQISENQAELFYEVDAKLAATLRAQYFTKAVSS